MNTASAIRKPWDARLAAWLVRPLCNTSMTPNYLTTVRLLTGVLGVYWLARGDMSNAGAWCIALSTFLDHTDGELARMSGKGTRFGHLYDLASDALIVVGLFFAIGMALRSGPLGMLAPVLGSIAGIAVAAIFHMRNDMEQRLGKSATKQPNFAGFEPEDVFYLLPAVTHAGLMQGFLYVAAVGAPLAAIIVLVVFLHSRRSEPA